VIGHTLAHYRITAALGAGGMGEVWRAEDTKLGREVALKVLPEEFASDPHRLERFEREARAVASLNHPHIVTIYSVEDEGGVRFLTMELVDGTTLDTLIPEDGLAIGRFFDLATPLAEAVSAAHDKSVIHRDLKPTNVMVDRDGRVKVMDFGLAKVHLPGESSDSSELLTEALTGIGTVVGTVPYMSPEQVEGIIVDHRTDIFSLGVLLYEMAIGERPFRGKSSPALMSSIRKDAPMPVAELRSDLPRHLGRIIGRCLEKHRRDRYQTARDVFNELRALRRESSSSGVSAERPKSERVAARTAQPSSDVSASSPARRDEGFWVAVLPFKYTGGNTEVTALAEGMTEEIVIGLSRFSYLCVVARDSTAIDARYLMEGSLRKAGAKLRVAVRLVDASTGAHLWAETYDRSFQSEEIFALQDELVPRVVSTVADMNGVLPRSMSETLRNRNPEEMSPYEAVLRSFGYLERATADELAAALSGLESAVRKAPDEADVWAMLGYLRVQDHAQGFRHQPDSLSTGLTAARRAVEAGPSNPLAYLSLAQALFHHREFQNFRNAAQRAAELNPMDGNSMAFLGEMLTYVGDRERGLELAGHAKQLNPNHPGWYWYVDFYDAYQQGDDRSALEFALKVNLPGHWASHAMLAAACGQLGDREAAAKAVRNLLEVRPDFATTARQDIEKWWDPEYVERLIDGWRKADLDLSPASYSGLPSAVAGVPSSPVYGAARRDEGFWVAVLPFKCTGGVDDLNVLAEGLSEDIMTGLSRFSYLRVIARGSARTEARYVMEGSLRQAGKKLRVAVQLVDTVSGAHLWAEAYDRDFEPGELFALQDDLVPRIVSTCADHFGVLARAISEAVRGRPIDKLSPYEALMRGFGYHFRLSPDEHAQAREALERAVEQDPANADCQAMLAWVCAHEVAHGFNPRPGSLDRALAAARTAVDLAPSNHLVQQVLAVVFFFRGETAACRSACERALALNPLDGSNEAIFLTCFTGDWDRGCALIRRAMELNPHHPRWYGSVLALDEYRRNNYRDAVDAAIRANAFDLFWTHWLLAAAHGQLGETEAARKALDDLLTLKPDFVQSGRRILDLWFQPGLVEHFIDGLHKAGLDIGSGERPKGASPSVEADGPVATSAPSIAVLPFTNMSADRDNDYFSDGLSEEIINTLSRLSGLRVIARSSAFRFRGEQDLRNVGELLGVRNVLEGSVRKAGEQLRITAQLIDVADHSHIWSERFDREMTDVFEIQDEIAGAIVKKLNVSLAASEPARRQTANVAAYDALLEGRHHFSQFTPEATERALVCFRRALSLDPDYPDALTFYAFYHLTMAYMFENPRKMLPKTREYAERALRLDPRHGEAQAAVAVVSVMLDRDWSASELLFRQALEAAPASARVHELYGLCCLLGRGRHDEALAELDLALKLDPLSALYAGNRGRVLTCSRRFAEAQESCRRGLALDSRQLLVQVELTYALLFDGKFEEAIAVGEQAIETHGPVNAPRQALALSYALAGRRDEAFELVNETTQPGAGYRSPLALGLVHAAFSEMDEAFACVEQSFEERDPLLIYLAVHPMFDTLRSDPRYPDLLRRLNLSEDECSTRSGFDAPAESVVRVERHTVGRHSELDALRTALDGARDGQGSLVCVAGESGIGKTTLVEEFLADVATDGGCTVARGRCSERLAGSDAYLPVLEALDSLLRGNDGVAAARIMRQLAPAWYAQIAPLSGDNGDSRRLFDEIKDVTQERLKRDFVACVQEMSSSRPVVVFLDDLHWADVSTIDLLSFLAGKFDGSKVLVVVTYRPSDMLISKHSFLRIKPDLQARGLCRELVLEFLHESEIADYLALEFPDHRFPPEFTHLIHQKTEGSPLFMADLLRYLRDGGAIGEVHSRWELVHGLPEIERELPESVRGMIDRKIGQLGEVDRRLLTAASVQGYVFDSAIVAQVLDLPADDVEERLDNLDRVHAFVKLSGETELPDRTLTLRYRFVHVLYQNVLFASLKPTRKARLNREVAQALEKAHRKKTRGVAHELAALLETGRDFARAAEYYLLAAGQASTVFAHREAAVLAAQGLGAVERLDSSPERSRTELELQLALGLALRSFRGFGHPDTGRAYSRARELCHEIGDAPQLFPVLFGLWEFFQNQGDLAAAVDVAEQMLGLAEIGDDQGLLVAAHSVMADNLVCVGDPVPASEHAERALALYEPEEHRSLASLFGYDPAVSAHSLGALALWLAGHPEAAIREATAGADLADTFSHPPTQAFGPLFASWIRHLTGSLEESLELAERCIGLATDFELPMFRDFGRVCRGWSLITQGEFETGAELARTGVDCLEAIEFGWARSFTLAVVAQGCAGVGRYDEALTLLEEAFDHAGRTGEHFHEAELLRLKGEFLLRSETHNEPIDGERCFLQAIEIAQRQQAKSWELRATTSLALLWRDEGRLAEARKRLERIYSWFTEGFDTSDLRAAKALLEGLTAAMGETREEEASLTPSPPYANESSTPNRQASAETRSIVVLPFANLSPDPDTEYFSDGLTDEIITDLSRVRALRVISRSSAMRLKGDGRGLAAISKDLHCRYVLEGSVRRAADTLRITARLVDAPNDKQLWADKYNGTLDDVFDIQERVSRSIVDALEIQLTPHEAEQLAERPIPDVRAQECYLRARREIWSFLPGGLDKAISHLEAGLALVGDNALLYQGLGEAYFQAINIGAAGGREEEYIEKAESCAEKIFALEPESARGHSVRAHLQLARGDIHGCGRSWRRVLQAYPRDVQALQLSAHILGWLGGKPDAAAPLVARLLDIDPLDPMSRLMSVTVPLFAGRFSEALEPGRRMFALDPVTPVWRANYVMALSYNRRLGEAEEFTEGVVAEPDSDVGTWWMGLSRAAWREDRAEVLRLADGPYQQAAAWDAEIPWLLASTHAAVGATEEALLWLDRAIDQGMINYPFLSEHDHYLDSIRGDERFGRAMKRARREWERFDV